MPQKQHNHTALEPQSISSHPEVADLDGWRMDEVSNCITKTWEIKAYTKAAMFVSFLAWLGQRTGHHPDIEFSFGKVVVKLTTHDEGAVTAKDFAFARAVETELEAQW